MADHAPSVSEVVMDTDICAGAVAMETDSSTATSTIPNSTSTTDVNTAPESVTNDASECAASTNEDASSIEMIESARFQTLLKALDKTVTKSLSACKFSAFAKAYGKLYKQKPKIIKKVSESFLSNMHDCIMNDIKDNLVEDELPEKLVEFGKLKDNAGAGRTWRPSGDVETDLIAHTVPHLKQHRDKLQETLTKLNEENELLMESIRQQNDENHQTQVGIQRTLAQLQSQAEVWEAADR